MREKRSRVERKKIKSWEKKDQELGEKRSGVEREKIKSWAKKDQELGKKTVVGKKIKRGKINDYELYCKSKD